MRVGTVLNDKWKLDALLGVGGMAAVYAATHRNGRRAALKVLHHRHVFDADIRARFVREGLLSNSIAHPAVVPIEDDDCDSSGAVYLVMPLLVGETIEQRRLRLGGRLTIEEVLRIGARVLAALEKAHAVGVLHRDIKPENLFLTEEGRIFVLDFGLGKAKERHPEANGTLENMILGSPGFMAPEQAQGDWSNVSEQTDIWSVAATLSFALTGVDLYQADTVQKRVALVATQPISIDFAKENVPPTVAQILAKGLAFNPRERWASASEMREALLEAARALGIAVESEEVDRATDSPTQPKPLITQDPTETRNSNTQAPRPRRRLVAIAVVLLAATGIAWLSSARKRPPAFEVQAPVAGTPFVLTTERPKSAPSEMPSAASIATEKDKPQIEPALNERGEKPSRQPRPASLEKPLPPTPPASVKTGETPKLDPLDRRR